MEPNNSTTEYNQIFYEKLGSFSIYFDIIQLFFFAPYSFLCFILNIITVIILMDKKKYTDSIYDYFKIYISSNCILCILVFIDVFIHIPRFGSFSYSYSARTLSCGLIHALILTVFSFITIFSIIASFNRLSRFVIKFKSFKSIRPYRMCFYLGMLCIFFNMPVYFLEKARSKSEFDEDRNNLTKLYQLESCEDTVFGQMPASRTIFYIIYVTDFIISLLVETATFAISGVYYNRFLKVSFGLVDLNTAHKVFVGQTKNKENKPDEMFKKIPHWVTISLGIVNLILIVFCFIQIWKYDDSFLIHIISTFILNFVYLLKCGNNFFLMYICDSNFKKTIKNMFKIK